MMELFHSNNDLILFLSFFFCINLNTCTVDYYKNGCSFPYVIFRCYAVAKKLGFFMTKIGKHHGAKCKLFMTQDIA